MNQRFCLFYAGFTAHIPMLYFNQLALVEKYEGAGEGEARGRIDNLSDQLKDACDECFANVKTAESLARHFEVDLPQKPEEPDDYLEWIRVYVSKFEEQFPMARIDHYYFLYARRIAEILCHLGLAKTHIELMAGVEDDQEHIRSIDKCFKDTEFILFKLIAAAALLSSEHGHHYFNVFYKEMKEKYEVLRGIDAAHTDHAALKRLCADLEEYRDMTLNGFKKCISILKELGV